MADCPTCGLPYQEGAKFCPACGGKLPVIIQQHNCKICGNTLSENAKFCNICGSPTGLAEEIESKAEKEAQEKIDNANPTMDEIQIPVITDEMLGLTEKPLKDDSTPTMDSIYMPGQEPAAPKPKPVAAPTQEEIAMASQTVTVGATPIVSDTPNVMDMYSAGHTTQTETILTPEGQRVPAQQAAQNTQTNQSVTNQSVTNQFAQTAQPSNNGAIPMGSNYIPGGNPQQQNYVPHAVHNPNVVPGKGFGSIVPILLIIGIIIVILVDVFVLFREQIFGDDDAKDNCAIVTVDDFSVADTDITLTDITLVE